MKIFLTCILTNFSEYTLKLNYHRGEKALCFGKITGVSGWSFWVVAIWGVDWLRERGDQRLRSPQLRLREETEAHMMTAGKIFRRWNQQKMKTDPCGAEERFQEWEESRAIWRLLSLNDWGGDNEFQIEPAESEGPSGHPGRNSQWTGHMLTES